MSNLYRASLKAARKDEMDLPKHFIARTLRASSVTAMRSMGADYTDLQSYVGQSVGTVLSEHYDHVGMKRLEKIAEVAEESIADNSKE